MSPSTLVRLHWVLAWLMPSAHAEALLGDLLEERRLRRQTESPASATRWYWMQLASSLPVLLWTSLQRGSWFITIATAVASFVAAVGIQLVLQSALMTTSKSVQAVIVPLSFAATLAACGYVAASIRLGAARLLAFLVFAASCAMLAISTRAPLWYDWSLLVLGPVATIAGAALSGRLRRVRL
jgi:hypothetical protein